MRTWALEYTPKVVQRHKKTKGEPTDLLGDQQFALTQEASVEPAPEKSRLAEKRADDERLMTDSAELTKDEN